MNGLACLDRFPCPAHARILTCRATVVKGEPGHQGAFLRIIRPPTESISVMDVVDEGPDSALADKLAAFAGVGPAVVRLKITESAPHGQLNPRGLSPISDRW